jgi:formylglycine-generating enzyme required for sulfatase activity
MGGKRLWGWGLTHKIPAHEVCVDGFWIGKYEVTQGQWKRIMGDNPSHFNEGDNYPVETVSWNDVKEFIKRLNAKSSGSYEFRLPTEAEWEYACRSGGKAEEYCGGSDIDSLAWYEENSGNSTHKVGTKTPNGFGIYDMTGNIEEMCEDIYADNAYSKHSRNNPIYTGGGTGHQVVRGGCWFERAQLSRSVHRGGIRLAAGASTWASAS